MEENLDDILSYYGLLSVDIADEEYRLLRNELLPLAEEFEFSEVSRLVLQEEPHFYPIKAVRGAKNPVLLNFQHFSPSSNHLQNR